MEGKKILVTGGAGYIGAHTVVALVNAGYRPVVVDNFSKSNDTLLKGVASITGEAPTVYEGDCCDANFLRSVWDKEPDIGGVIHFAAYKSVEESVRLPLQYYKNNVGSLLALLEVMSERNVTDIIFSSSCTVYGQADKIPVDEAAPFKKAESPYGASKQLCENILDDAPRIGVRAVSLRYFNPIGAHPSALMGELPIDVPANLVPYVTQTAAGVREQLTIFGGDYATPDGTCLRDYIHVADLANAHIAALTFVDGLAKTGASEVFNIGTGKGISVLELVKSFEQVTGVALNYQIGPRRPGDVIQVYAEASKANSLLQWTPEYSMAEALLHAWNWEQKLSKSQA